MSLDELRRVVPPPNKPIEAGNRQQWKMVERRLALRLPTDLFDLAHAYGTGFFIVETSNTTGDVIKVYNPFSENFWALVLERCRIIHMIKEQSDISFNKFPFSVYPNSVGLFPIGNDDNGGVLCWQTEGSPTQWPIIANPPGYFVFERFDLSLTNFLTKCFTGEISCVLWGEETFERNPRIFFKSTKSLNPRK